jgi:hypothetical protein
MSRSGLGIVSLLLALVLGGALWAMNVSHAGPTSEPAQRAETQARLRTPQAPRRARRFQNLV